MFDNDFDSCLTFMPEDIYTECHTLNTLTIVQGQIRLRPATKCNLKAFVELHKGKLIIGADPEMEIFGSELFILLRHMIILLSINLLMIAHIVMVKDWLIKLPLQT